MRNLVHHSDHALGESPGWLRFAPTANSLVILPEARPDRRADRNLSRTLRTRLFDRRTTVFRGGLRMAMTEEHYHHTAVSQAYTEATTLLQVGMGFQQVTHLWTAKTLGPFAFLGGDAARQQQVARMMLDPLGTEHDLIQTVRIVLACNRQCTTIADQLYIHRNTLSYRLQKIALLIRYDHRQFDDLFCLQSTLRIADHDAHTAGFVAGLHTV